MTTTLDGDDKRDTTQTLQDQREANERLVLATLRAQEQTEEAEQAARELRRTAEFREQLLAIVGHDLKNPLGAIVMSAELLLRRGTLREQDARLAGRILNSAQRMSRMILQVLEFTRARLGGGIPIARRSVELREVADQVVHEQSGARVPVVGDLTGDLRGQWDADRLAEVLSNLVGNAIDYATEGTSVVVRASSSDADVTIEVENQGEPVPPELVPVLFEPFKRSAPERARTGHLGLGLYIAREIVLSHGGTLDVRSSGGTTTFAVCLPRERGCMAPAH